jgi:geranylgeranyl diphosphate synthase type II
MLGGDLEAILPYACSIELIHTYSLIHDDLPCMDNDDYRRGKLTNHKVFGEAMAVLAGDALLNLAFEIMSAEAANDNIDCHLHAKTAAMIAGAAGARGMIGGQVIDMESEGKKISYEQLCKMHEMKTGALLKASILAPAELFNAPPEVRNALDRYSRNIGLAFQIKDDILDFEGDSVLVGKSVGSDEKNKKSTFVTIMGIKKTKDLLKVSVEHAVEALKPLTNNDFLIKTAAYIAERDK